MKTEEQKPENPNAFPFSAAYGHPAACGGMTLRDYFAAKAMQTILNQKHYDGQQLYELSATSGLNNYYASEVEPPKEAYEIAKQNQLSQADYVAELSYLMADAMLKQREL